MNSQSAKIKLYTAERLSLANAASDETALHFFRKKTLANSNG
ncbi:hypothetical protein ACO0LG_12400 [Undibacterium sp. Ji42W]